MSVIKRLGSRVEEEHSKHLNELRRLEETSGARANGGTTNGNAMDFESLVRGGGFGLGPAAKKEVQNDLWSDDSPRVSDTRITHISEPRTNHVRIFRLSHRQLSPR